MKFAIVGAFVALTIWQNAPVKAQSPARVRLVQRDGLPDSQPKTPVSVDHKAAALWARTTRLYGALDALKIEWKERKTLWSDLLDGLPPEARIYETEVKIGYDASGLLRLEDSGWFDSLKIIDGSTISTLSQPLQGLPNVMDDPVEYKIEKIEPGRTKMQIEVALTPWHSDVISAVGEWLQGENRLGEDHLRLTGRFADLAEYRVVLLAPLALGAQKCDLVQVNRRTKKNPGSITDDSLFRSTFWLSQKDGRLLRVQSLYQKNGARQSTSDIQVTVQDFKPRFDPQIWVFTPPPGAILKTSDEKTSF